MTVSGIRQIQQPTPSMYMHGCLKYYSQRIIFGLGRRIATFPPLLSANLWKIRRSD